jgi:hypothetical protein
MFDQVDRAAGTPGGGRFGEEPPSIAGNDSRDGYMIEAVGLTKNYGPIRAVDRCREDHHH